MRKGYKEMYALGAMEKRGQVAIFVIIALVIVSVLLLLVVYPRIQTLTSEVNPSDYMQDCLDPELTNVLPLLTSQGGYYTPTHYTLYKDQKIQYLCYTAENYQPCIIQQPLLVRHVQQEITSQLQPKAQQCIAALKQQYEREGYTVNLGSTQMNVSIIPGKIIVAFESPITVTKAGTQTFRTFVVSKPTELYDLLLTATSILQFESTLGDSETSLYLQFYPNLKIEKLKREADTIYTLTNVITDDTFTFATRSLVWPSGLGL